MLGAFMQKCVEMIFHFTNNLDRASEGDRSDNKNWWSDSWDELVLLLGASIITNGMKDLSHRSHEEMSTFASLNLSLRCWTSKNMQLHMFSVACEFGSILRWCSWSQQEGLPSWWCLGTMLCGFAWCRKVQQFPRTVARDTVNLILKMCGGFGVFSSHLNPLLSRNVPKEEEKDAVLSLARCGKVGVAMKLHEISWYIWWYDLKAKDLNRPYQSKVRYPHPAFLYVNT